MKALFIIDVLQKKLSIINLSSNKLLNNLWNYFILKEW